MEELNQRIAELANQLAERDDEIEQLRREAAGAAQAVHEARAAADNVNNNNNNNNRTPTEVILKNLQIPQAIRDLITFDGNPIKLHTFIRSVDNILPLLANVAGRPIYDVWMQAIRAKITSDADNVLEIYGVALNWTEIKNVLITHYSDKRDEVSLTRELFKQIQTGSTEEFYGRISQSISLLINLLNLSENNEHVKAAKKQFYQEMGLKVFLGGLKDPYGPTIRAQTPKMLKEALRLCLEEANYKTRVNPPMIPPKPNSNPFSHTAFHYPNPFAQNSFQRNTPPKIFQHNAFSKPFQQNSNSFLKPFQQNSNAVTKTFQQNSNPSQQNTFPKPFQSYPQQNFKPFQQNFTSFPNPKQQNPEPMDIDPSIRSKRINYMNRPQRPFINYNLGDKTYDTYYDPNNFDSDQTNLEYTPEYESENQAEPEILENDNLNFHLAQEFEIRN